MKTLLTLSAIACTSLLLTSSFSYAGYKTIIPETASSLSLTIYNKNLAFVSEDRAVLTEKGEGSLVYQGVPSRLIKESVIASFSGVKTYLFSQNYAYNTISLSSMLKYSLGSKVSYIDNSSIQFENPEIKEGLLLSISPVMIKELMSNKIIALGKQNQVIFDSIPSGMITKPSLVWNVETEGKGNLDIGLQYLTRGISWKSDYVLSMNEKNLDLSGWITINNNSGVTYKDASITCLAGEVNRVSQRHTADNSMMINGLTLAYKGKGASKEIKNESFSGYHIYKIPFKETLLNKEQKQITFINRSKIPFVQYGKAINSSFHNYGTQKIKFQNIVEFENKKENGLGIPLPSGTIRIYGKDKSGKPHFSGEDKIGNVPKDEIVKLKMGVFFDVVGEKKISKFSSDKYSLDAETTYTVKNRGESKRELRLIEKIQRRGRKVDFDSTCAGICSFSEKDAFTREYTIHLDPSEIYDFKSSVHVEF